MGSPFPGIERVGNMPTPKPDEQKDVLKESLDRVSNLKSRKLDQELVDQAAAEIRLNTVQANAEAARIQSQFPGMNQQVPPLSPGGQMGPTPYYYPQQMMPQMPGMGPSVNQTMMDILTMGQQRGIDVTPAIAAILGQRVPTAPAVAEAQPKWLDKVMEMVVMKTLDGPKEDPRVHALEQQVVGLKSDLKDQLGGLKALIEKLNSTPPVDPQQAMINQMNFMTQYNEAISKLMPKPAPVVGGVDPEHAFKIQDRAWEHEEKKEELAIAKARINADIEIATKKEENKNEGLAMLPQLIGGVIVQAMAEKGNKEKPLIPQHGGAPQADRITLAIAKSEDREHGPITIACPNCRKPLTLVTSSPSCQCVACGTEYNIKIVPPKAPADDPGAAPAADVPAGEG